jgi:hypothetical protein
MTKMRYFFDFADKQEHWLNNMAKRGYRLAGAGKLTYRFEQCEPCGYEYRVELVADKSAAETGDYKKFLEDLGYRVFHKNANLNFSFGKARFRPIGGGFATSPGSYNNELLIVEKPKGHKPFKLHTDPGDLAAYFRNVGNMYVPYTVLGIVAAGVIGTRALNAAYPAFLPGIFAGFLGAVGLCGAFLTTKYAAIARRYAELANTTA